MACSSFLDGVKEGWGEKFGKAFAASGIDSVEDFALLDSEAEIELETELKKACKHRTTKGAPGFILPHGGPAAFRRPRRDQRYQVG